jgi:prepilin signal peptidase PulO-like enzyme (type II secretory pathway)
MLLLSVLLVIALTPLVVRVARMRALRQPARAHLGDELTVVATVVQQERMYAYVHQLKSQHFVDPDMRLLWGVVEEHCADEKFEAVRGSKKQMMRELERVAASTPSGLRDRLEEQEETRLAMRKLEGVAAVGDVDTLLKHASPVYNAGVDRCDYSGNSRLELTGDNEQPVRRVLAEIGAARYALTGLIMALGFVAAARAASGGAVGWLNWGALAVLVVSSTVWTLVDLDTLYVDMPSFYAGTALSWALVTGSAAMDGGLWRILTGLIVAAVIVGGIELVNQFYKVVRGQHGMGSGDYLLMLATIGVPSAVLGDWVFGQINLIVSLLLAILGWVGSRLFKDGFTRYTPYAFGPYLACGWMVTLLLWVVV